MVIDCHDNVVGGAGTHETAVVSMVRACTGCTKSTFTTFCVSQAVISLVVQQKKKADSKAGSHMEFGAPSSVARSFIKRMKRLRQIKHALVNSRRAAMDAVPADVPLALKKVDEMYKLAIDTHESLCKSISESPQWPAYLDFQEREVSYRQHIQQVADEFGYTVGFPGHWF